MEKMPSVLGYRWIPSPSYRQILFNWIFQTHCRKQCPGPPFPGHRGTCAQAHSLDLPFPRHILQLTAVFFLAWNYFNQFYYINNTQSFSFRGGFIPHSFNQTLVISSQQFLTRKLNPTSLAIKSCTCFLLICFPGTFWFIEACAQAHLKNGGLGAVHQNISNELH